MSPAFIVEADDRCVVASSAVRLPFEPKGDSLSLRAAIRRALAGVTPTGLLHATYSSAVVDACDAENVLFYNVGMSHFRRLSERGILFERVFTAAPDARHAHHHRYEASVEAAFGHWAVDTPVLTWHGPVPTSGVDKPAPWWWATTCSPVHRAEALPVSGPFALVVRISPTGRSLPGLLKPMFDGVIAACHTDAQPDAVAVDRVALSLGVAPDEVRAALSAPARPLGERRVVRSYREGVQWNPADDRCVAGALLVDESLPAGTFAGSLFPVR